MPRIERRRIFHGGLLVLCYLLLTSMVMAAGDKKAIQAELRKIRQDTLEELYRIDPKAKQRIRGAAGYGVFAVTGAHVLFLGGSGGYGVVRDNLTGRDSFMRMAAVSAGLGVGFKDARTLLVFTKREVLKEFVEHGWTFGGEAQATAKVEGQGGDLSEREVVGGIEVYQFTQAGLMAKGTVQGSKYWKDDDLN